MRTMKLEYRLKLADLIEVERGRSRPEIMIYVIIFEGILLALYLIISRSSQGELYFQAMLVPMLLLYFYIIIGCVLIFYLCWLSRYFTIKRDWQRKMRSEQEFGIEISDEGFQDSRVPLEVFAWSMFDYWRETSNLVLIYDTNGSGMIFPKRVFSVEQIEDFKQILNTKLIYRKRSKLK
jgi:uncharacterized integral membrane protein